MFNFDKKYLISEETRFEESVEIKTGKTKYFLHSRIVPRDQISRNNVLYNWNSIKETMNKIVGLPLMHNHKFKDANILPRGEWISSDIREDGAYGVAEIYNTKYNEAYIEWIKAAKNIPVSLQVTGKARKIREGVNTYQEVYINDYYEISTVNVPGFRNNTSNLQVVLAEALNDDTEDKDDIYVNKVKLDQISNRRYGRTYDELNDKERNKVLYSTDIEKDMKDQMIDKLDNKLIDDKEIEAEIEAEEIDNYANDENHKTEETLSLESADEKFFSDLNNKRFNFLIEAYNK